MVQPFSTEIVGSGGFSRELREFISSAARSTEPVLLLGEAGTGKEMAARAIHYASSRRNCPFLMIDCSLFYERELERELFGYRPGSDEPVEAARQGLLEFALRGSCYAANVEELSPSVQLRLLNLLDTGYIQPVGSDRPIPSRARLIFSSEKNLKGFSEGGLFSEQLFRRFEGMTTRFPPLRERSEDVEPLVRHFLRRCVAESKTGREEIPVAEEAVEALRAYPWPGNLDELKKEIYRIVRGGHSRLEIECLASAIVHHWRGRRADPAVAQVVEEIQEHIQEFRLLSRLDSEYGDVLLDSSGWDVLFKAHER